jgi:hypothetical protein
MSEWMIQKLKFSLAIRHLPSTHDVSSDHAHISKPKLPFFIKIAAFKNVWNMMQQWIIGVRPIFHSPNQVNACTYSISRKHG